MSEPTNCPCGRILYCDCCAPFHQGNKYPETAEQLMRSRYSAFALNKSDYLLTSWHPDTRPGQLILNDQQQWIGLKITQVLEGRVGENNGEVTFVARYKINGRAFKHREKSRFCRYSDRWMYLHGETLDG